MNVVICEDEKYWSETLKAAVSKWAVIKKIDINFSSFTAPQELIEYLKDNNDVDVLFLDISLGKKVIDGMALAKHIRKTGGIMPIIFVTGDSLRAADGYIVEAMGYLTKPIEEKKLALFLDRIVKHQRGFKSVNIISGGRISKIYQRDIVYVEITDHTIVYHTMQSSLTQRGKLREVLSTLDENCFVQIHRSYVIALERVDSIKSIYPYSVIVMSKNKLIDLPVSRKYIDNLLEMYTNDLLEKMI